MLLCHVLRVVKRGASLVELAGELLLVPGLAEQIDRFAHREEDRLGADLGGQGNSLANRGLSAFRSVGGDQDPFHACSLGANADAAIRGVPASAQWFPATCSETGLMQPRRRRPHTAPYGSSDPRCP